MEDHPVTKEVREVVEIEPTAIQEEYVRCPSDLAYYNEQHSWALRAALEAKAERERLFGALVSDPDVAAGLETRLGKKPSVDQLKGEVLNLDEYRDVKREEISTHVEEVRLRGVIEGISAKKEMLISLGADMRLELQREPLIRE